MSAEIQRLQCQTRSRQRVRGTSRRVPMLSTFATGLFVHGAMDAEHPRSWVNFSNRPPTAGGVVILLSVTNRRDQLPNPQSIHAIVRLAASTVERIPSYRALRRETAKVRHDLIGSGIGDPSARYSWWWCYRCTFAMAVFAKMLQSITERVSSLICGCGASAWCRRSTRPPMSCAVRYQPLRRMALACSFANRNCS